MIGRNNYNYVWGFFDFSLPAQNKLALSKMGDGYYKFYPFEHDGDIFTIDTELWKCNIPLEEVFYPELSAIDSYVQNPAIIKSKDVVLIAFYSESIAPTIDANNNVAINKLPKYLHESLGCNYKHIGFDIVDVTGLSGLANIGYESSQLNVIKRIQVKMTRWGLVHDEKQAVILARIISEFSPEHAPFLPMEIWMKKI